MQTAEAIGKLLGGLFTSAVCAPLPNENNCGTISDQIRYGLIAMARRKKCGKTNELFDYAHDNRETIVYQATNTVNGKRYIGITRTTLEKRRSVHLFHAKNGRPQHFYCAIRKYGSEAFSFATVTECSTYKEACAEERRLIAEMKPEYNMTAGGEGILGYRPPPSVRAKMSAAKRGRAPWAKGKFPKEVIAKLSQKATGRKMNFSNEAREKLRGNIKRATEAKRRPTVCLNDHKAYESTTAAAKHYGMTAGAVQHICLGTTPRSRTGLVFQYVDLWWGAET